MRNFIARTVGYRIQVRNVHEIRRLRFFTTNLCMLHYKIVVCFGCFSRGSSVVGYGIIIETTVVRVRVDTYQIPMNFIN